MTKDFYYFKFHVDRYLTDDKLKACSDIALAVYPFLLCILWKQKQNKGKIILKQHQRGGNRITDFAQIVTSYTHFSIAKSEDAIRDLSKNDVIQIEGVVLSQQGMLKDIEISCARSEGGKEGMKRRYSKLITPTDGFKFLENTATEHKPRTKEQVFDELTVTDNEEWANKTASALGLPLAGIKTELKEFLKLEEIKETLTRSNQLIKEHFVNWIKKGKPKQNESTRPKRKTYQ